MRIFFLPPIQFINLLVHDKHSHKMKRILDKLFPLLLPNYRRNDMQQKNERAREAGKEGTAQAHYKSCQVSHVFFTFKIRLERNEFNENWSVYFEHIMALFLLVSVSESRLRVLSPLLLKFEWIKIIWWIFCFIFKMSLHLQLLLEWAFTCKLQNRFQ